MVEGYWEIIRRISEASDAEVEHRMQCFVAEPHDSSVLDEGEMVVPECGIRWAVEKRRGEKVTERQQIAEQEQGKKVRFREEEHPEETRAQSIEQNVTGDLEEVRTGRGSAGLVRREDERCRADETSGNVKGKGNGGQGGHGCKGGFGSNGMQQGMRTMKDDKEEEEHRQDVSK